MDLMETLFSDQNPSWIDGGGIGTMGKFIRIHPQVECWSNRTEDK